MEQRINQELEEKLKDIDDYVVVESKDKNSGFILVNIKYGGMVVYENPVLGNAVINELIKNGIKIVDKDLMVELVNKAQKNRPRPKE